MRRFRRGFRRDSRGDRGLHDLADLGVRILLREVPRGESLRVGAARIEALLEEEAHDVDLEREVDGGDGLAVPHGGVQRGVAVGVDELEEILGGAGIEVALAGLQVQTVDRVEKRLAVKGRNRGNRVAEGGEVAGGTVFEEMVAETDRRFARLEGKKRGNGVPESAPAGCCRGRSAWKRGPSRGEAPPSAEACGRSCPVDWDRIRRRAARSRSLRVRSALGMGSTVGGEIAGVMEGKQTIGTSVEFAVRTFVVCLNIF